MTYSPPKKITVIISFLILIFGLLLLYWTIWPPLPDLWPVVTLGDLSNSEFWGIFGMIMVFLGWFLLWIGV
ncbi:MAG: hypothetical protein KGD63_11610 [Candidatus Lokiarchaeota archaeon]|nr:hypothetical protein [Candidatus Lokiarchaeota archaeon]